MNSTGWVRKKKKKKIEKNNENVISLYMKILHFITEKGEITEKILM